MEVLNDLLDYNNLKIYQNTEWFSFSLDSVLLPNFVTLNKNCERIIDLGTGNAPIPLILSTKVDTNIFGVEIQKDLCELAIKSIEYNQLLDRIKIYNIDIKDIEEHFPINSFDLVLSNPPYFPFSDQSKLNDNLHKTIARHEIKITLEELVKKANYLLKENGIFAIVHRTERMIDIIENFNKYGLKIKKIQFVYPKKNSESNIMLVEARKTKNKNSIKILEPLYIHNDDGSYTDIVKNMFK